MSHVAQSVPAKYSTTDYLNKSGLTKTFGLKFQKRMILTSKSQKSENFILSLTAAIIPNIQRKIAVKLFNNLAFMKLSRPLRNNLRGF